MMRIPYYPSREEAIKTLLKTINIKPGSKFMDLGCGDSRILIELARKYDDIKLYGVDINPYLVNIGRRRANRLRLNNIFIQQGNLFNQDLNNFDIIYVYLTRDALKKLYNKFVDFLNKGGEIIAYDIPIPNIIPAEIIPVEKTHGKHYLYYYKAIKDTYLQHL